MDPAEIILVLIAGFGAGAINSLVGSGTLITFPALLSVGFAPVTANVSNTIGLVPGSLAGAYAYRRELSGQSARARGLAGVCVLGGATGALCLLLLPDDLFEAIVPAFIIVALVLILLQPRIAARLAERNLERPPHGGTLTATGMGLASVYGGYFGAAQGIIYLAVLGSTLPEDLQRINALKNVLAALVNGAAGVIFLFSGQIDWLAVLLIAVGSTAGGSVGGRYGRRLPPEVLRGVIVVMGVVALVNLLT